MTPAPSQVRWTLRRRLGRAFGTLAAALAVLVAAVVVSTVAFVSAGNAVVYRWQPALTTSQRLLADLVDQETGVRGYALSHEPSFLAPYPKYRTAQAADSRRLHRLVGHDDTVAARVAALDTAIGAWQKGVAEPALGGIRAGRPSAVDLVGSAEAKRLFDVIRARAAALSDVVDRRVAAARHRRSEALVVLIVALSLATAVCIAAAAMLWRGLHRWVLEPVDRLGRQTRTVAAGETHRRIVPDGPIELAALGADVEAMRQQIAAQLVRAEEIQEELRRRGEELARSNDDLQQFAYVASHDLSEPLRKVANFCQLLERQYGPQLDDRARQYIDFAVDGAKRMQVLISDLLALSRVGRTTEEFVPVDLQRTLDRALTNLEDKIVDAGARIDCRTPLPTVAGDLSLLTSLLENLVGNALKYRQEDVAPVVTLSAERDDAAGQWTVTVCDNGIGIDPQYAERIFVVFQRLHLRDRYGGTGIGLALCRKIVEFHGGRIWLDSVESSRGATFRFTIPEGGRLAQSRD